MFRIISAPSAPVPTYVCDTKNDLPLIVKEQFDGNMIGITVLCLEDKNVYMMNGDKENSARATARPMGEKSKKK